MSALSQALHILHGATEEEVEEKTDRFEEKNVELATLLMVKLKDNGFNMLNSKLKMDLQQH